MAGAALLWPTLALVALVFAVWFTLFVQRLGHIRQDPPGPDDFANREAAMRYFRPVEKPANNLANLFEMPVLYFALAPLLLLSGQGGRAQVVLAWLYVALRVAHSWFHIGAKQVQPHFMVYLASCAVLSAMWIGFAVDIVAVA